MQIKEQKNAKITETAPHFCGAAFLLSPFSGYLSVSTSCKNVRFYKRTPSTLYFTPFFSMISMPFLRILTAFASPATLSIAVPEVGST